MLDNLFPQIDFVSFSMLLISIDLRYRLNDTHFFFDMDSFSSIIFKIGLFIALNTFQTHTNTHNTLSHYTIFIKSFKSISPKKRYYVYLEEFCFVERLGFGLWLLEYINNFSHKKRQNGFNRWKNYIPHQKSTNNAENPSKTISCLLSHWLYIHKRKYLQTNPGRVLLLLFIYFDSIILHSTFGF